MEIVIAEINADEGVEGGGGKRYTNSKPFLGQAAYRGIHSPDLTLLDVFNPSSQPKPQLSGQNYKSRPDS